MKGVFLVFFVTSAALAKPLTFKYSEVQFLAVGNPGFLTIKGSGGKLAGSLLEEKGKMSGTLTVNLNDLDTGIDLRNKHMKEKYLETAKFPKALLDVKDLSSADGDHEFAGKLTLKGVTKPVTGKYTVKEKAMTAEFKTSLKDFPIGVPSYLGVSVAEDVTVTVEAVIE